MALRVSSLLFIIALFLVIFSTPSIVIAFNITRILEQYPDYATFNGLLTQANLPPKINSRQTITVLAIGNNAIGSVSGKPMEVLQRILSNHIVLDYYDDLKLDNLKKSSLLTTLYQTTGVAQYNQGFLNVSKRSGEVYFGSAVKGAPHNSKLLGVVMTRPFNISVLHVSDVIIAPGFDTGDFSPPSPPGPAAAPTPTRTPEAQAPPPLESDETPTAAPTRSKARPPKASPPAVDAPAADSPDADGGDNAASSSSMVTVGSGVGFAVVIGLVMNLMGL